MLLCCGVGDVFWLGDDPLERVQDAQPLAAVPRSDHNGPPNHASERDELVFLNDNAQLEVYRIDAKLSRLRVVALRADDAAKFGNLSVFPRSPRAVVYERSEKSSRFLIINTETGETERQLTLPKSTDGLVTSVREVVVSPDERWLGLYLAKTRIEGNSSIQDGWRPLTVVDLQTGEAFELVHPNSPMDTPSAITFVGANSVFVQGRPSGDYQLWELPTRQLKWARPAGNYDQEAARAVSDGVRIVAGSYSACRVLDVETGRVVRSHRGTRAPSAVALHPNGDYIAGYSSQAYTFHGSYLSGAVRIWDAAGERRTTFLADQKDGHRMVTWLAVSKSGDYLVTACRDDVRVWDYNSLPRR